MSQWLPIKALAAKVQAGELSAVELVKRALEIIEEKKAYNAVLWTSAESALARAAEIDAAIQRGEQVGRLAGVPFLAKDMFMTLGDPTSAASNVLKGFKAPYRSTVIGRLESEGAICVGHTNQDAFGHGTSTENSDYMIAKNPRDKTRVPGGSSGGAAASVVLEMVPFALGTDTGGSTRQPASLSGCVGYKPTYGLMSRYGVIAMASSTDTVGTLARTVEDAALVVDVMAGRDPLDSTTIERDTASYADLPGSVKGKKIGIIKEWMGEGVSPEVVQIIQQATGKLKAAGADVQEISVPSLPLALAIYYIVVPAEVSSNLSRYDGQRYPFSFPNAKDLDESYTKTRGQGFGKEAKRRIMIGTYVLSSGYYDAYYRKAQTVRTKLIHEFNEAFGKVDFLIGPVAPTTAFKIGEKVDDPLQLYLEDLMTVGPSLAGLPAISIPAGEDTQHLPVGLHMLAPQRHDRALLSLAKGAEEILA